MNAFGLRRWLHGTRWWCDEGQRWRTEVHDLRVKDWYGDERKKERCLNEEGDERGPAVAGAEKWGGLYERFFEHGCTSMELDVHSGEECDCWVRHRGSVSCSHVPSGAKAP